MNYRLGYNTTTIILINIINNSYILMIDREIVHVVQRTQAVGNIVHSNTIVLQVHNHTNRLSNGELLY